MKQIVWGDSGPPCHFFELVKLTECIDINARARSGQQSVIFGFIADIYISLSTAEESDRIRPQLSVAPPFKRLRLTGAPAAVHVHTSTAGPPYLELWPNPLLWSACFGFLIRCQAGAKEAAHVDKRALARIVRSPCSLTSSDPGALRKL